MAFASSATTQVLTGLDNGTTYTFTVAATNALGAGAASDPTNPATPSVPAVAAGGGRSFALVGVGGVSCWGLNNVGQLGRGTTQASTIPVPVAGLADATTVVAGLSHTCALRSPAR